jgi:hypothetical protein
MPEIISQVTVTNMALAVFGGGAITAFEEGTPLASTCKLVVPRIVDRCQIAQAWRMNHVTRQLERVAFDAETDPQPPNGWRYGYAFPADALRGPHKVSRTRDLRSGAFRDFDIEGRRLFCDLDTVFAAFTIRLSPDQWGPTFLDFVVNACAAELCIPVCDDKDHAASLFSKAWGTPREGGRGGLAAKVLDEDVATRPGFEPAGDDDPLTAAHLGGSPWPDYP